MKNIDFTHTGGFPLTQDQMGYLQTAWQEVVNQLVALGVNNSLPTILSGMQCTTVGSSATVADGWFVYNGSAVRFPAQTYTAPVATGNDVYIVVTPTAGTLTFNDGSTPAVVEDTTGVLAILPVTTPVDSTHFLYSALQPFGVGLAQNNRDAAWNALTVATPASEGGVSGIIYYKKDYAANTLRMKSVLSASNAQNFAAFPSILYYDLGISLPTGCFPTGATGKYFTAYNIFSTAFKDFTDTQYIENFRCALNTSGSVEIVFIKPDITISSYDIIFDAIVSLD